MPSSRGPSSFRRLFLRTLLIYRNAFLCFTFPAAFGPRLAGQVGDSLSAARRIVAATALAAEEYAVGVAPAGGTVLEVAEVEEARMFVDQARFDIPLLPVSIRGFSDSALTTLRTMLDRVAAPAAVRQLADSLNRRLAAALAGGVVPAPAHQPSLERGARIYRAQCVACHGETGRGDGPKAKGLVGPAPTPLADPAIMGSVSSIDVYRRVTLGVPGTGMPQYEEALSEDERWAVTAFVMGLSRPHDDLANEAEAAAVFASIRDQVDSAVARRSDRIAFAAYLSFERVENDIRVRDRDLVASLESGFAALRTRVSRAPAGELDSLRAVLLGSLKHAERLVGVRPSAPYLIGQSLLLLVREGFEAILIIAALMTFLTKSGASARRREVAFGAWAAVAASAVTAILFELLFVAAPGRREALEGFTMLLAALVLFYVSYWMVSKIVADRWSAFLERRLQTALSSRSALALASVAFLAVYREGVEAILFYKALLASGGPGAAGAVAGGVVGGAVVLVVLYLEVIRLGARLPMRPFFALTGALLYYMAFVFVGKGIVELQDAGIIGAAPIPSLEWLRIPFLGVYPTVQSLACQGVLLALAVVAVVVALRPREPKSEMALRA